MEQQKTLRDVSDALEKAVESLAEIEHRALYENQQELTFEQKVIHAVRQMDNGDPLKDFLTYSEIDYAVKMLADVFTVTGVKLPAELY